MQYAEHGADASPRLPCPANDAHTNSDADTGNTQEDEHVLRRRNASNIASAMMPSYGNARSPLLASLALVSVLGTTNACGERTVPVIGIAMGADVATPQAILPARQQRFNDSVGTRHRVMLRIATDSTREPVNNALAWAKELSATRGLVGIVGHESSRSALQAAPVYRKQGVVQIVPTGTSGKLATVSPWTFPLVASDASQGEILAQHIIATGRKLVTLFVQDDEYGRGIVGSVESALRRSDVRILENVMHTPTSDFDLLVRSMHSHVPRPDVLVLVTQGGIAAKVAELSWKQEPSLLIMGSDATISGASELRTFAPSPDLLALATYWLPDSNNVATRAFLRDFRDSKLPGQPQWNHAALHDAVGLLSSAAAEVGGNPTSVRDWMKSLGRDRPAYKGVLGDIDFTGQHAIPARLMQPSATGWELVK